MNQDSDQSLATHKLSDNIGRLLNELARDFENRCLTKCHSRGFLDIRLSHCYFFSVLGNEQIRLTELAERTKITQQAMGKLVKELEQLGYLERTSDSADKRAKIISLTSRGKDFLINKLDVYDEIIAEYKGALGEEKINELEKLLRYSVSNLNIEYLPMKSLAADNA